ncbi:hypothetical protein AB0L83_32245 [Streptomyces sp. NPDC052071]|uniref:hypothetical protein n=1 Tax=Streptomyces sp. NPDC052071 TaxID=3156666 RepID=UPI0034291A74
MKDMPEEEFSDASFGRAWEPVEHVVVHLDRISNGLTSPLDYPVMLHTMVLLEEWQVWRGPGRLRGLPEPEFSEAEVLRRLEEAGIAWPDGREITAAEVFESLFRLASVGAVRGLRLNGGTP